MNRAERILAAITTAFDAPLPGAPTLVVVDFSDRWTASEVTLTFLARGIMHDWRLSPVRPLAGGWLVIVEGNSDVQPDEFVVLVDQLRLRRMGPQGPSSIDGFESVAIEVAGAVVGAIEAPGPLIGRRARAAHGGSLEEALFGERRPSSAPGHEPVGD